MKAIKLFIFSLLCTSVSYGQMIDKDFSTKNLGSLHTGLNQVVLTFDDGPTPGVTDKILDTLNNHNIKATFFVIGSKAKAHPELLKRMVEEGHTVANHTMNHLILTKIPLEEREKTVFSEVMDAHQVIAPYLTNSKKFYFRAPGGGWDKLFAGILNTTEESKDYVGPIYWDVGGETIIKDGKFLSSADWECWSKKRTIDDCESGYINEIQRRKGGVVLMHDLNLNSSKMLEKLIPDLISNEISFFDLNDIDWEARH